MIALSVNVGADEGHLRLHVPPPKLDYDNRKDSGGIAGPPMPPEPPKLNPASRQKWDQAMFIAAAAAAAAATANGDDNTKPGRR